MTSSESFLIMRLQKIFWWWAALYTSASNYLLNNISRNWIKCWIKLKKLFLLKLAWSLLCNKSTIVSSRSNARLSRNRRSSIILLIHLTWQQTFDEFEMYFVFYSCINKFHYRGFTSRTATFSKLFGNSSPWGCKKIDRYDVSSQHNHINNFQMTAFFCYIYFALTIFSILIIMTPASSIVTTPLAINNPSLSNTSFCPSFSKK